MLDGYDEYRPGTNKDIDDAIEKTVGSSVLIPHFSSWISE